MPAAQICLGTSFHEIFCTRAEFWARYIRFLEPDRPEAAKDAMRRAQGIHCKGRHETHLLAARFHERHGDPAAARTAYELVLGKLAPGLVSAVLASANFERRQVRTIDSCAAITTFQVTFPAAVLLDLA